MEATKNDISSGTITLDYQALITTAEIAYRESLDVIYNHFKKLTSFPDRCSNVERYLYAQWLSQEARGLVIVAETLSTLLEGLEREETIIVNKSVENDNNNRDNSPT